MIEFSILCRYNMVYMSLHWVSLYHKLPVPGSLCSVGNRPLFMSLRDTLLCFQWEKRMCLTCLPRERNCVVYYAREPALDYVPGKHVFEGRDAGAISALQLALQQPG